jgi:cytochrome bd-type quinol oxidase subunit 2
MIQKIKKLILQPLATLPILFLPFAVAASVATTTLVTRGVATAQAAACTATNGTACPDQGVCAGATTLQLGTGTNNGTGATADCSAADQTSKVNNIISTVLNVFSVLVGIIAVVMIIYAGFKYISSGGKEESVKTAKNTILYAIIGLVIVALAQLIVKFVLEKAITT